MLGKAVSNYSCGRVYLPSASNFLTAALAVLSLMHLTLSSYFDFVGSDIESITGKQSILCTIFTYFERVKSADSDEEPKVLEEVFLV